MTLLTSAISRALIHFVWEGSIIGFALGVVLLALKKRSANARYVAACLAMAALAGVPVATAVLLYSRGVTHVSPPAAIGIAQWISSGGAAPAQPQSIWLAWFDSWAVPVWSLGVVIFSMRLAFGYGHAFVLRRRGKPAVEAVLESVARLTNIMGVRRPVRVLMSSIADSPSVVGWLRPVILLPAATLMGLTTLQLEAVLAHEIGHIKRYDYLVNMLQMVVETLLFYHPAVWWASKRIRVERELCCDDLAVQFSGNALRYARALTTLEKLRVHAPDIAMASTGGPLLYRIQRLMGVTTKEYGPSRFPMLAAIAFAVSCAALNVPWIKGQDVPGVKVDLGAASVIHRVAVPYPESAQKRGITGTVQLEVKLDSNGNVVDARVLSGPEELRKGALESVLNWHFTGDSAGATRLVSISFSEAGKGVQVREPQKAFVGENQELVERSRRLDPGRRETAAAVQEAPLTRRQELEREMGEIQRELKIAEGTAVRDRDREEGPAGASETQQMLRQKLDELKREFESTRLAFGRVNPLAGRTLKGIATLGLGDSVRSDLLARLPIREGDVLSPQLLEQTAAVIRNYDEHLRLQFLVTNDNQAELRISAPGERR
jgi:TonB family protein